MDAWIYDAVRTPRGKARPDGSLAANTPQALVGALVDALETRGQDPRASQAMVLGCVGQIGDQGGNIALVSKLHSGVAEDAYAFTLNNYCVSGLTAIGHAATMIAGGAIDRALAGGVEMMSRVPFMGDNAGYYTDASFPKRSRYIPVVVAADRLAQAEDVSREQLDAVALASQVRTGQAEANPALIASRIAVGAAAAEECARPQTTAESLAAMPAAFAPLAATYAEALDGPIDHRHTIAHAPPVCDGAGLAVVGGAPSGGCKARARILAYAESGGDPQASLLAGFSAMDKALARAGLTLADMDRVEFMEAFAVTIAKFLRDRPADPAKVNVGGGHLAKGHPMGATGAILLSSLLDALDAADGRLGLVVATGAAGVGAAMVVERLA
ncbi:acetyl-CoA C-acetyltransferase/acetyl-CoA acyltransferase [Phenylobacterium haematophilum]|uniref:Acetyl-CoA C-acetyltransferase/acetyl-CoA acyltransferase n=1 Tax=Phenylobacterium haematophilum TaxID=98513 RepID=A0A839ZUR8_9CAUL|nr:acetyl-CoA C-acetyltransferase/acetyl-CoA acyltransferase [Phenylobacterium haematophilum]